MEFITAGSPRDVSRAIEEFAVAQGNVTALVVPWETEGTALSMAVTAVRTDGWAIEHTNLGTIRLSDAGNEMTRVAVAAHQPDYPERAQLAAFFNRFAQHVRNKFEAAR